MVKDIIMGSRWTIGRWRWRGMSPLDIDSSMMSGDIAISRRVGCWLKDYSPPLRGSRIISSLNGDSIDMIIKKWTYFFKCISLLLMSMFHILEQTLHVLEFFGQITKLGIILLLMVKGTILVLWIRCGNTIVRNRWKDRINVVVCGCGSNHNGRLGYLSSNWRVLVNIRDICCLDL